MYRGLVWPLRLNTRGDFQSGTNREVIKSDIRTALFTRRYVDETMGGERKMRPGAFSQIPFSLIRDRDDACDDESDERLIAMLVEEYIYEALQILVNEGKIAIREVRVQANPRGVRAYIGYSVLEENLRDEYTFEIATEAPVDSGNTRRV